MEKTVSLISLLIVIALSATYITREITKNEFSQKLDNIETIRDSLIQDMAKLEEKLLKQDEILIAQINASYTAIHGLQADKAEKDEAIREADKSLLELIKQLQPAE